MADEVEVLRKKAKEAKTIAIAMAAGFFILAGFIAYSLWLIIQLGGLVLDLQDRVKQLERPAQHQKQPATAVKRGSARSGARCPRAQRKKEIPFRSPKLPCLPSRCHRRLPDGLMMHELV